MANDHERLSCQCRWQRVDPCGIRCAKPRTSPNPGDSRKALGTSTSHLLRSCISPNGVWLTAHPQGPGANLQGASNVCHHRGTDSQHLAARWQLLASFTLATRANSRIVAMVCSAGPPGLQRGSPGATVGWGGQSEDALRITRLGSN